MTTLEWVMIPLGLVGCLLALVPFLMFWQNLAQYLVPPLPTKAPGPISVLIPARNEESAIGDAIAAVIASKGVEFELLILDDHSTDKTAQIIDAVSASDPRVRRIPGKELPRGWCGKQHACWQLAQHAQYGTLVFLDADVRLEPEGLVRMAGFLESSGAALVSGVPRQITVGLWEKALIPLIPFVLLGFLPISRMRQSRSPAFAAGCGQFFVANREAYFAMGGHETIKETLHDGIRLPKAFRQADFATDLADATPLARCRMYTTGREVRQGLMKNATEGLARKGLLLPATFLLFGGQVLPIGVLFTGIFAQSLGISIVGGLGTLILFLTRAMGMRRFAQDGWSVVLHPFGVLALLFLQWGARLRSIRGKQASWRGRTYPAG